MITAPITAASSITDFFDKAREIVRDANARILAAQSAREANAPAPALTHCPVCAGRLERVYETFGTFLECGGAGCYFTAAAPVMEAN